LEQELSEISVIAKMTKKPVFFNSKGITLLAYPEPLLKIRHAGRAYRAAAFTFDRLYVTYPE
jgi:hypothetical protein